MSGERRSGGEGRGARGENAAEISDPRTSVRGPGRAVLAPHPSPLAPRDRWRRRLAWTVASLVLTGLVALSLRAFDWTRVLAELRHVRAPWLLLALVANTGVIVCWTALWREFLPAADRARVTFRAMFEINSLTSALMNTTPLLVGHASGVAMLVRRARVDPPTALGVIALDQLGEGVSKVLVFVVAALLLPLPPWMRRGVIAVAIAVAALLAVLVALAHRHAPGRAPATPPSAPRGTLGRMRAFVVRWARDLEALRSWRRAGLALLFALGMKTCEGLGIVAVQRALGVDLPLAQAPLVLAAVILATMIPLSPGNLGPYEAATLFVYKWLGLPSERALSVALIQHLAFLVPALGVGYLLLLLGPRHERQRGRTDPTRDP